ncbi:early nodulin-like protein 3 [Musa acuminata AAA Group]|uniref:early nodulin-like protein 3 n=1 Tax=Musa acuminata AAA Group TaxID=214697 RepID=UPI0031D2A93F
MERVMELRKTSPGTLLLVGVLMGLMASSGAYDFYVGGRDGWVSNPSESYDKWAGRNRFQVNDTLVFRYRKEVDSVLVVTKQDYDACNASNPIQKLEGGDSTFKFDRSGPFYFISGVPESCRKEQKLTVVVLAIRNQNPSPPPPSSPPSLTPSPSPSSSASPSSSPSPSPTSPVHAPTPSPTPSPSPSTTTTTPPAQPPASAGSSTGSNLSPTPPPSSPSSVPSASRIALGLAATVLGGALLL